MLQQSFWCHLVFNTVYPRVNLGILLHINCQRQSSSKESAYSFQWSGSDRTCTLSVFLESALLHLASEVLRDVQEVCERVAVKAPYVWVRTFKAPVQNRKRKPFGPSLGAWFCFILFFIAKHFFGPPPSCLFVNRCTLEGSYSLGAQFSTDTATARGTCWSRSTKSALTARRATSCHRVSNLGKAGSAGEGKRGEGGKGRGCHAEVSACNINSAGQYIVPKDDLPWEKWCLHKFMVS